MKRTSNLTIILLSVVALVLLLACNMPTGSKPDSTPVVASTVEATAAASIWENSLENAPAGSVSVTFTESQLTSVLDQFLKKQDSQLLTEPQLRFRDGKIDMYGKVTQGPITTDMHLNLLASVDAEGKPVVTIESGEVGPVPLPDGLKTSLSSMIDSAISGYLKVNPYGLKLQSITVGEGLLTITGTKQ